MDCKNTAIKDPSPLAPENTAQLCNPARRVGLRERVKAGLMAPAEALAWIRKVDPNPNPTIIAWLEKKAKVR